MHGGMVAGGRESCCAREAAGVYKFIFQVTSLPMIMGKSFMLHILLAISALMKSQFLNLFLLFITGEKQIAEFGEDELRCSLEWVGNKWNPLKGRKDIASNLTSTTDGGSEYLIGKQVPLNFDVPPKPEAQLEGHGYDKRGMEKSSVSTISRDQKRVLADLTNDLKLDNLRWRPRKRSRRSGSRKQSDTSSGSSSGDMDLSSPSGSFGQLNLVPDEEICKSSGEQSFMGLPVQVPNLVMSR